MRGIGNGDLQEVLLPMQFSGNFFALAADSR
jgi:hypothetical protein